MTLENKRIEKIFNELQSKKEKGLITFVTAGDPDYDTFYGLIEKVFGGVGAQQELPTTP